MAALFGRGVVPLLRPATVTLLMKETLVRVAELRHGPRIHRQLLRKGGIEQAGIARAAAVVHQPGDGADA